MAGSERARTHDVKPATKAEKAGPKPPSVTAPAASRLPSPAVAAAILAGAERTVRTPFKPLPSRPKTAPPPLSSEKSAARVQVPQPLAPPATAVTPPAAGALPAAPKAPVAPMPSPGAVVVPLVPRGTAAAKPASLARPAAMVPETAPVAPKDAAVGAPALAPALAKGAAAHGGTVTDESEATSGVATATPGPPAADTGKAAEKGAAPGKGESKEVPKDAAGVGGEGDAAEGGPGAAAATVKLHMPEPPTTVSPATAKRIGGVKRRAGGVAAAKSALPPGKDQVGDARGAVDEPSAEAKAKAQQELIATLNPAPSPEIVKRCERIREVIRNKRPPDEDALMEAKPEGEALNAGNQLNSTVQDETKKVQDNYGAMGTTPAGAAPSKGQDLPPQPAAAQTPGINAAAATPDAVPAGNVSLDKDAAASKQQMQDAGMEKPAAQLVQSGPVAEARNAQGELEQAAKEDPVKVLEGQKQALAKAEEDMAALQMQALASLNASRATTAKGATSAQKGMVGSEESMRTQASADANQTFKDAQDQVTNLLKPLAANAIAEWEAAKDVLVSNFKADLAPVQKRVDERHSGVGGFFTGLWDAVTGLPGWAEEGYAKAEKNFGDGVCNKITEISVKVNAVIATCETIIKSARERIAKIFADLPQSLGTWAAEQQKAFDGKLDGLQKQAIDARDNFNKDLLDRSAQAVDEVRAEIAELCKKAGGLVGRIANAIRKFVDDPVKFIIEGLLELLGIPPASFWAVVAKIKKVIKEIADDVMKFANNLMKGLAMGFGQFFDNIGTHLLKGFLSWLTGGLGDVGVQLPKDLSLKSIITFFLQLMGITWPRIRKVLAKHVGEKNVALLEKVYQLVSFLIEKGPEGIYEMIKEKLDPQAIVDQVIQMAVDYLISAVVKAATARILMLFNPAGAILQALEAVYRVLKWIFQNAARIFTLIETVVNGIADILAGSLGGFANAVEKALAMLIAPVIGFIADYLNFGDLPDTIAKKIKSFQDWIMGLVEKALVWLIEKGKALLAAMGIGKKDDKKEKGKPGGVGEDLQWTVGKESHHMWIAAQGSEHTAMMASEKPHPVRAALVSYTGQVQKLKETDEERADLANKALKRAGSALTSLEKALDAYGKVAESDDADKIAAAKDAVSGAEEKLKHEVAEVQEHLGLDDDERVKKVKGEFGSSPFSTAGGLAPFLKVAERTARAIIQVWVQRGVVFRIQSAAQDPLGMSTFDPTVAGWREVNPNNRQKYGYVNPKKTSSTGLTILSKGLLGSVGPDGRFRKATSSEKQSVDYHVKLAHYESARSAAAYPDFLFDDAILGHKEPGASGHWNREGHKQARSDNYAWNQDSSNYQGPEHWEESSASGAEAERYELPAKEKGSHSSWLRG